MGTLTLLFTDIEGSTVLLDRLGLDYRHVLAEHRRIVRAAVDGHGGREISTEGDSFFVVFATAEDGLRAAVETQQALAAARWPEGTSVRVRMGLHTGAPVVHEDTYVGMDVHLAARVSSIASGGQVLLTDATRVLLPPGLGVRVVDAGMHRLKDIPAPQRLHQVVLPGAPDPPPVRSLGSRSDLPAVHGQLIGRQSEVEQVLGLLGGGRVVTVVGPGGVGKSRLALEVARRRTGLPDGVYFVPLGGVRTEEEVWRAFADAAAVPGGAVSAGQVVAALATRSLLLVLDNLEHLPGAGQLVSQGLDEAPGVEVLVTSRSPLRLRGEQLVPLQPLRPQDAVELYLEHARRQRPGFDPDPDDLRAVEAICVRLDRLPLAIELVAARSRLLGPRAVLDRLDDTLDVEGRAVDRSPRQLTLRSTLDWSWRLLPDLTAAALARLSVFRAPFGLEAAAAVLDEPLDATVDLLLDLSDASLLHAVDDASGDPRFRLLKVVGRYAAERLAMEPDEQAASRARQVAAMAPVVARECGVLRGTHHIAALDALEEQADNIDHALDWCLRPASPDVTVGLEMCRLLSWYWYTTSSPSGRRWLGRASEVAGDTDDPAALAAWHGLAILLDQQGDSDRAVEILQRCLDAAVARGDRLTQGRESNSLGLVELHRGSMDRARELLVTAHRLAREDGDEERVSTSLNNLALLELAVGHAEEAVRLMTEVLSIDERLGDVWGMAVDRLNLAQAHLAAGDADSAAEGLLGHGAEMLALGDTEMDVELLEQLALLALALQHPQTVPALVAAADSLRATAHLARSAVDEEVLQQAVAAARTAVPSEVWLAEETRGRTRSAQQAWEHARDVLVTTRVG